MGTTKAKSDVYLCYLGWMYKSWTCYVQTFIYYLVSVTDKAAG